jgi:hypothetical protein
MAGLFYCELMELSIPSMSLKVIDSLEFLEYITIGSMKEMVMRMVPVSTDVFAAIWQARWPGEDTEDAVLRRVLGLSASEPETAPEINLSAPTGFLDSRFGVAFPVGFRISRVYQNREYQAQAVQGVWIRADNGTGYRSLNQLSVSLGASENAWDAWFYADETTGERKPIAALRNPQKVRRRSADGTTMTPEELGLAPH